MTISIGYVTESYSKNTTLDSLVSRADRALYVAKNSGRNTAVNFSNIKEE
ncbi:diguanylate cyclase domain-containing protein [Pantoea sp. VS1]|nr:diguanylate cyclase [Pantoea sp. VS1]